MPFAQVADEEEPQDECFLDECGEEDTGAFEIVQPKTQPPAAETTPKPAPIPPPQPTSTVRRLQGGYLPTLPKSCTQDTWTCYDWGECSEGLQVRRCILSADCPNITTPLPALRQSCKAAAEEVDDENEEDAETFEDDDTPLETENDESEEEAEAFEDDDTPLERENDESVEEAEVFEDDDTPLEINDKSEEDESSLNSMQLEDRAAQAVQEAEQLEAPRRAAEEVATEEKSPAEGAAATTEAARLAEEQSAILKEAQRLAEESARKRAEEERLKQEQEAVEREKEISVSIEETAAFREAIGDTAFRAPPPVLNLRRLEQEAGDELKDVENEVIRDEAQLILKVRGGLSSGTLSKKEAQQTVQKERLTLKRKKIALIVKKVAKKKYNQDIADNKQDTNNDGSSDEAAVVLGVDPQEPAHETADFTPVEKKIYRTGRRITTNIRTGDRLSLKGATALVSCPANERIELYTIDASGKRQVLETKTCSSNGKAVFTIGKGKLQRGKYVFLAGRSNALSMRYPMMASVLSTALGETSEPAVVDVVEATGIAEPVVESIEGVNVGSVRDIRVSAGEDGRITVSGSSDIDAMVIGTFESAVFTSAMLADIENGYFEITSGKRLDPGSHEVVIYANKPDENTQSPPVKVRFSIIPVAVAAPLQSKPENPTRSAAQEKFPIIPVAAGAGVLTLLIIAGKILTNKRHSSIN